MEELGNPFADTGADLYSLETKQIMSERVVEAVRSAEDMGKMYQYQKCVANHISSTLTVFKDILHKNNQTLFLRRNQIPPLRFPIFRMMSSCSPVCICILPVSGKWPGCLLCSWKSCLAPILGIKWNNPPYERIRLIGMFGAIRIASRIHSKSWYQNYWWCCPCAHAWSTQIQYTYNDIQGLFSVDILALYKAYAAILCLR